MKKFKVEYAADAFGSEFFSMDDLIVAETEEAAIELAKDSMIEASRANGYEYEEAVEENNNYVWRAQEVIMKKNFIVEYNPIAGEKGNWYRFGKRIKAESEEEAIEIAKCFATNKAISFGISHEKALGVRSYSWRAKEV